MSSDPVPPSDPGPDPVTPTPLPHVTPVAASEPSFPASSLALTDSGLTPNVAAGLAVLVTLISGLIFLFLEKRNPFVRYWAMQSVFFGAATFAFFIAAGVVGAILGHIFFLLAALWWLLCSVIYLGFLAVWIVMLIKAFSGKEWDVPVLGALARQQLGRSSLP